MALEDDQRDFDKWFNDFTLDGIVAVRENLAMIDKVISGMVRVGPGHELGTDDYIELVRCIRQGLRQRLRGAEGEALWPKKGNLGKLG